jgi:hypothetical protein
MLETTLQVRLSTQFTTKHYSRLMMKGEKSDWAGSVSYYVGRVAEAYLRPLGISMTRISGVEGRGRVVVAVVCGPLSRAGPVRDRTDDCKQEDVAAPGQCRQDAAREERSYELARQQV